ncbi:NADH-quinone oxidoreductase subunit N [Planotetraspora sp. A-T 1434]|uniref:NADH-quinone oxidoreductase subunit N n=1 Tax=Planotetraspora sp. A-T 1434 TaxID=2979219 RepID=UPI0021BE37AF|nr:NADH-quinone oxidoreductase subunit N [Planotetraspora sp. A-T 1434]MCT9931950.1 NADH-quinone oxidoreductase subunit N [Planotetraspora sp. A-T 1434]
MIQSIDYAALAVPLILTLLAGLVLVLDAFLPDRPGGGRLLGLVTLGGVLAALAVLAAQAVAGVERRTFCVPASLEGGRTLEGGRALAGGPALTGGLSGRVPGPVLASGSASASCSFVVDRFTLIFAALVLVAGAIVVLLSMGELAGGRIPVGEWYFLLLSTLVGAILLAASRDLIMLVVSLELVSLPVFALTALKRYDGRASEAALKLFLVSVVSTAIMLFGVSLLYGITGSVHLDRIAESYEAGRGLTFGGAAGAYTSTLDISFAGAASSPGSAVTTVAVVLVLAGFAFKIAAVPFHFWAGDVYQGAPIPVAALLSVISKAAGFAGLILILTTALPSQAGVWAPVVAVIAALTMTVGNVLAMRQRNAVRLLAWSSVAQSGYILAPLAVFANVVQRAHARVVVEHQVETAREAVLNVSRSVARPAVSLLPADAGPLVRATNVELSRTAGVAIGPVANASIAYLVFYAAMNLAAFAVVMLISRERQRNEVDDYRGLAFRSPGAALALAFSLICLAGLPPGLSGLFAKVVVFREIVDGGLGWLAVVMAVNTVIGLYYYIAWTAKLFTPLPGGESRTRSGPVVVAIGVAILITVVFSVAPQVVLSAVG